MENLNIAIIGLGARGSGLLKTCLKFIENIKIVAICDLYSDRIEKAKKLCL